MEVSGQRHAPVTLPGVERNLGTHSVGGWVGYRTAVDSLDKRKISCPYQESNPGVSRP